MAALPAEPLAALPEPLAALPAEPLAAEPLAAYPVPYITVRLERAFESSPVTTTNLLHHKIEDRFHAHFGRARGLLLDALANRVHAFPERHFVRDRAFSFRET